MIILFAKFSKGLRLFKGVRLFQTLEQKAEGFQTNFKAGQVIFNETDTLSLQLNHEVCMRYKHILDDSY